ncbi:MAG: HD domain-containing protein [Parcubacteria group bacterium]|jgi:hypothetical protein
MKYIDRIYGEFEISEPVILEIIQSPEMQRLKGVDNGGYLEPYFPKTKRNRFDHSIGVYLLLKKYRASLEEQIAGLIHDVSHPVFSHAGDYYFSNGSAENQSHQDNSFEKYVRKSDLPKIFKKYNIDLEYILNDENFPIKENNLPDICADRIDYSLREILIFKIGEKEDVDYLLNNLEIKDGRWIFYDFKCAKKYANYFRMLNKIYWCDLPSALMFMTVRDYMRYSLEKKYINLFDLYTTDGEVLSKISYYLNRDERLRYLFDRMNNKIKVKNDSEDFQERIVCKSRVIDPLCYHDGRIQRVSDINLEWKEVIREEIKPKEYFLKFLE